DPGPRYGLPFEGRRVKALAEIKIDSSYRHIYAVNNRSTIFLNGPMIQNQVLVLPRTVRHTHSSHPFKFGQLRKRCLVSGDARLFTASVIVTHFYVLAANKRMTDFALIVLGQNLLNRTFRVSLVSR